MPSHDTPEIMSLRRHTIVAALVIAGFVALQAIWFLGNYDPDGVIKTESQAIAAAHGRLLSLARRPLAGGVAPRRLARPCGVV
ncbi:MAG TPA: hypothetical protein VHZ78_07425 [Rhizomicrobium sp.]|nr:hypothetical protein [Rhizomicrobium sp.]